MAKRVRTTVTVREDDPVPPRKRRVKKSANTALVFVVLAFLGLLFLLNRTHQVGGFHPQSASHSR
jgi:hypothetical protein